jgi:hypothetical protein
MGPCCERHLRGAAGGRLTRALEERPPAAGKLLEPRDVKINLSFFDQRSLISCQFLQNPNAK